MPATPESHHSGDGSSTYNQSTPIGASVANTPPDPDSSSFVKVTRGHSCVLCQQRKVRCDKKKPCSNCVKAGVDCRVVPPQPPRRRKKRIPERDLVDRLRKYEALLSQNGIEFESLGPDIKITDPGSVEEGDELDPDFNRPRAKASPAGADSDVISSAGEKLHRPRTFRWFPFQKEFRPQNDPPPDSSEEEDVGSTINHAYDQMFGNTDGFPFAIGGQSQSVTELHPSGIQIFQLWQIYLDNVNPLLKLTHTPTLQAQIIEASTNLTRVSKSLEALMFAIYLMAITSLNDDEVEQSFNGTRSNLLAKYQHGTQQALINAGFMRMPDLTVLQAYLLYCYQIGVRQYTDPRTLFCYTGMGVRLAQRLGLQRDGAEFGFSPFEVEERRRLWWNLAGFDRRIGEMCGSTITAISTGGNCKLPLNINDADLNTHAKDSPPPHTGATEMIFTLTRLEFAKAPGNDKMKAQLSAANPQAVTNLADHRLSSYLDQFAHYMEETYLKYCDPKIPVHYMTLLMTRASICKLKVVSGFFRVVITAPLPLPAAESESLLIEAIRMIEYDSMIQAHERLKGFLWYTRMYFPFPAYVCLLGELRQRTTGDLCERAWETIFEHAERRKMTTVTQTPLHLAFSSLFVKAWDAREAAEAANGRTLAPPRLITVMRQIDARMPKKAKDKTPLATPSPKIPVASARFSAAPAPAPSSAPTTNVVPSTAMYHPNDMFSNMQPAHLSRQFSLAFPDVNFGGEMDWNYLIQEYGGFMPQPSMHSFGMSQVMPDPTQAGSWQ
ncbi:fungal-specific transcription factor domain-containing protein [Xylaria bambusicola]|uniref:fungal-specific transcription factor domain-containing protein n=1 Tax=Xylaria bambusicola TaxID=326684 RepID=UPI00200721C0|nr:fungal-specific transcription factor domain-containing protein [Xylaria bambusicola]KAI0514767.1 fungal-specific transcription factor domain-containing protein [Xylaria bambusicola]